MDPRCCQVPYTKYFEFTNAQEIKEYFDKNKELCRESVNQLIEKYNIKSKKILSIGAASGFEEYWFYKNGCQLTFLDYDESNFLESYLKKIPIMENEDMLTYIIDDAKNYKKYINEKFDVIYFSGFSPSELRNSEICSKNLNIISRFLRKITRKFDNTYLIKNWPNNQKPFIDLVIKIIDDLLKNTGLFIYQSYASDVYAMDPNYLKQIKNQLNSSKIQLLSVYYVPGYPSYHLIIGFKGTHPEGLEFIKKIHKNPEIQKIHGRGLPNVKNFKGVNKVYSF